ncbi:MAG: hypothetical protein KTQ49_05800, partial [Candidatus Omnitrophica bacterium]|nr:hypothetical protein [Candidatus Omnitrophota bacterium]
TPMIGMVGLIEDAARRVTQDFKAAKDVIVLLGSPAASLAGSEYLRLIHKQKKGDPSIDIEFEKEVQAACQEAIREGLVKSAHDVSEGGLAICLAESCISNPNNMFGARVELGGLGSSVGRLDVTLFGESPSRIMVTVDPANLGRFETIASRYAVPCLKLGTVEGERLVITNQGSSVVDLPVRDLSDTWRGSIPIRAGLPAPLSAGGGEKMKTLYNEIQSYINQHWD